MKTYKIYIIRNGLTKGSIEGKYIGHTDEELCEEGRAQVVDLATKAYFPEVDAVFSSPLKRCIQTAKIIYPDKEPIEMKELMECDFGDFEGMTADELKDDESFRDWLKGGNDAAPPFGETNGHFSTRICNGFIRIIDGLLKTGTTSAAIVTHGGIIMSLLSAFGIPEAPMTSWRTPSGCGYMITANASIWSRIRKVEVTDEIPYTVREESEKDEDADYYWDNFEIES